MQPTSRIAQAYGYAVCLIGVITVLICTVAIVNSLFDLAAPLRADGYGPNNLSSFTAYKRDRGIRSPRPVLPPNADSSTVRANEPNDTELRQAFEDERVEKTDTVRFRAMRTLVTSVLVMAFAIGLFLMHWRWLRREDLKPA